MNGLIRETNENLRTIINTMKENFDNATDVLENLQSQMDKKVEEAKKYKIEVDSAKAEIKAIEEENKNLELSLNELTEKYSKMNLTNIIEAGNKEIKLKINENIKDINKNKERIAELTNKARAIKDLLISFKNEKNIKEERLENLRIVYEFYSKNLNEIIEFAYNYPDKLETTDYHNSNIDIIEPEEEVLEEEVEEDYTEIEQEYDELENTMVFDEIAFIDGNKNFKDEMTFINNEIEEDILDSEYENNEDYNYVENIGETTEDIENDEVDSNMENVELENDNEETNIEENELFSNFKIEDKISELVSGFNYDLEKDMEKKNSNYESESLNELNLDENTNVFNFESNEELDLIEDNMDEVNDYSLNIENEKSETMEIRDIESKIDKVLKEKSPTLTDIFGNPIKAEEIDTTINNEKKIEELFIENGIDFNKFKEDEQNYLIQIYDEKKFEEIFNVLNKYNINVDNIYYSFNILGEISADELDTIINKLINIGQNVESIGMILEKMPKIKKYDLDKAIASYNEDIKTVDIVDLIVKAKELYTNGGSK